VLVTGAGGFIGRRLVKVLVERGKLAASAADPVPIEEIVLVDRHPIETPAAGGPKIATLAGDLGEERLLNEAFRGGIDSIFHLAATLTIDAERDLETGWAVNLQLPFRLLEACRRAGRKPRFVYASSIAVFGGALPGRVSDTHVQTPQTSYGTAKAITELLINDYSRHGFVDGRALRLPIVVIRPGKPTGAISDVIGGLARDPLAGLEVTCPLGPQTRFPVVSVGRVAENLVRLHDMPADAFNGSRAVNQPGLTVSVADIAAALERVAGPEVAARIRVEPVASVERVVAGWPREFVSEAGLHPPLDPDPDFESIVRGYLQG
jgi:nucleoside-diphosphate-sugar epimerase